MGLKDILRMLPPQDQGLTVQYGGETFPMPYQSFTYKGEEVQGLRENRIRIRMFEKIFQECQVPRLSLLDIGSNMGTIAAHFQTSFDSVYGIECDPIYLDISAKLYPYLKAIPADLNSMLLAACAPHADAVLCLSMIENIKDMDSFIRDLFLITGRICIVEGHSETIYPKQLHYEYEHLLKKQPWKVARWPELTDAGLNAPVHSVGRPVWICVK